MAALALAGIALLATFVAGFVALAGGDLATGFALDLATGLAAALATGLTDFLAPEGACALTGFFGFGAGMMNLNTASEHGKKRCATNFWRERKCKSSPAGRCNHLQGFWQDVWANIWGAVLAVNWPSHGGFCAVALARSGGAAVALA
jgi:hypothetical protein